MKNENDAIEEEVDADEYFRICDWFVYSTTLMNMFVCVCVC